MLLRSAFVDKINKFTPQTTSYWANSSVPISFKIAFAFWSGIPNLCDKYLKDAASSPSVPKE